MLLEGASAPTFRGDALPDFVALRHDDGRGVAHRTLKPAVAISDRHGRLEAMFLPEF